MATKKGAYISTPAKKNKKSKKKQWAVELVNARRERMQSLNLDTLHRHVYNQRPVFMKVDPVIDENNVSP